MTDTQRWKHEYLAAPHSPKVAIDPPTYRQIQFSLHVRESQFHPYFSQYQQVIDYLSAGRGLSASISVSTTYPALFSNSEDASLAAFSTSSVSALRHLMNNSLSISAYIPYHKRLPRITSRIRFLSNFP